MAKDYEGHYEAKKAKRSAGGVKKGQEGCA